MAMKAAVVWEAKKPITIEEVDIAKPQRREVLLRTVYAGICHSDLHFTSGLFAYPVPFVPGHESSGVVEAIGDDVTYVKPGDHVVTCLSVFCGACNQCLSGHPNLCESTEVRLPPGVARRLSRKGDVVHQFANLSSFAEMMLVHEHALAKIDKEAPLDKASVVGCGVLTGFGAVVHSAKVFPGATVAVIGCGGVGLSAISAASMVGAGQIIAIDILDEKLALAKSLGATDFLNARTADPVAAILEMTKGGVQFAFEALGNKKTVEQSFAMLRMGGVATVIGMIPPGVKIELEGSNFLKDRKIQGSSMGGNRFRIDIPDLMNFYMQGRLKLEHLISGRIPLSQINEGYEHLEKGGVVRQLFDLSLQ
jgi:S-(hydroxymethyl)glutathione dehydrogenase/alcohol dehydrogenase